MPTYDYICKKCEKMFEYFQSMSDAPKKECPDCKENSLRRIISGGTGLIFKGSGYYLTDYKNKKSKEPEKKDSGTKKKEKTSKKKIES
jgi:putative FmdB family regulatory protein|tara:strand:+ start:670 stop:933 length:264 start_codon:yes stop_codon:yes gene_type:complete